VKNNAETITTDHFEFILLLYSPFLKKKFLPHPLPVDMLKIEFFGITDSRLQDTRNLKNQPLHNARAGERRMVDQGIRRTFIQYVKLDL